VVLAERDELDQYGQHGKRDASGKDNPDGFLQPLLLSRLNTNNFPKISSSLRLDFLLSGALDLSCNCRGSNTGYFRASLPGGGNERECGEAEK
jgi:hypothetical protein